MATGQPYLKLIMTWGEGGSKIHKQLVVNNDQSSPELLLLLFRKHLQGDKYQSRLPLCSRLRGDACRWWNARKKIMKSKNELCRILEPEKTFSNSSPFIHSIFDMYLYLEAINVLLEAINVLLEAKDLLNEINCAQNAFNIKYSVWKMIFKTI